MADGIERSTAKRCDGDTQDSTSHITMSSIGSLTGTPMDRSGRSDSSVQCPFSRYSWNIFTDLNPYGSRPCIRVVLPTPFTPSMISSIGSDFQRSVREVHDFQSLSDVAHRSVERRSEPDRSKLPMRYERQAELPRLGSELEAVIMVSLEVRREAVEHACAVEMPYPRAILEFTANKRAFFAHLRQVFVQPLVQADCQIATQKRAAKRIEVDSRRERRGYVFARKHGTHGKSHGYPLGERHNIGLHA